MIRIEPLGDRALIISFGAVGAPADVALQARVWSAATRLQGAHPAIVDVVPAYASVAVHYAPAQVACRNDEAPHDAFAQWVAERVQRPGAPVPAAGRLVEIPVRYGGADGPDLESLANARGLSVPAVVALHTAPEYLVHFVGFMPGFAYLGGLDVRLATPRREEPR